MSGYIAESITTDAGHFDHLGLCQLRTKLISLVLETSAHKLVSIDMCTKIMAHGLSTIPTLSGNLGNVT